MRVFQAKLELRDVTRSLGKDLLLNRVSFECSPDAPTAVLGLEAPAREAFLRLLSGVDKPQSGTMRLAGEDVVRLKKEKGRIVRVGPNGVKPSGQRVRKAIGQAAAERAGLTGAMQAAVSELDLEQRVRLAIAMAVEAKPGLILLDSPAAELEAESRRRLVQQLGQMVERVEAVVVLAGAPDEAVGLAGQVVVLAAGQVVQTGPAPEVMTAPANLAAARAIAAPALNTVTMTARQGAGVLADGSVFQAPQGVLVLPAAGTCTLAFRPEDVTLERKDAGCVRFVVRAAGGAAEGIAGRRYVRVTFAGANWLAPEPATTPAPGMMLNAFVNRTRLMVFDAQGKALH